MIERSLSKVGRNSWKSEVSEHICIDFDQMSDYSVIEAMMKFTSRSPKQIQKLDVIMQSSQNLFISSENFALILKEHR